MNFVRIAGRANCGHLAGGTAILHAGYWLCPACAARRWYQLNSALICEQARRAFSEKYLAEAVALCLMARASGATSCSPCPCGDRLEAAA